MQIAFSSVLPRRENRFSSMECQRSQSAEIQLLNDRHRDVNWLLQGFCREKGFVFIGDLVDEWHLSPSSLTVRGSSNSQELGRRNDSDTLFAFTFCRNIQKVFDAYASKLTQQPSSSSLWSGLKLGGFTWSHLFYVAYAQAQCPEGSSVESNSRLATTTFGGRLRERIVIPLSNDPAFHDTFTCRRGSGMNPDTRCPFWVR
ncbi:hypothetical protein HPB47_015543 [Ixodes persulcatus]|uniref:Uncharacterized protein n=1 Tax=Ixodes persulcatus TaxID=34615 RepID=A0AC60QTA3_IXOPE|nr:hypothetical protein HPB47_015543 [Ixodes persulcatus]